MFRRCISTTPMTNVPAQWFYSNLVTEGKAVAITCSTSYSPSGDVTLESTLKTLLMNKGGTDLTSQLRVRDTQQSCWPTNNGADVYLGMRRFNGRDRALIFSVVPEGEMNVSALQMLAEHIGEYASGDEDAKWEYQPAITRFFGNKFPVYCFINTDTAVTVVYYVGHSTQKWHWLQCALPAMIPWFFRDESGKLVIEGLDKEITNSLNSKDPDAYLGILQKIFDDNNVKNLYASSQLSSFEIEMHRQEIEQMKRNIREMQEIINNHYESISSAMVTERDYRIRLAGLEDAANANEGGGELADFFATNKALSLVSADNSVLMFIVKTTFDIYDSDYVETWINNKNSILYRANCGIPNDDLVLLFKAAFVDEVIRIRTCASYRLDIRNMSADGIRYADYSGSEFDTYIPNPHIQYYSCTGNYRMLALEAMRAGNYIGAITQFIASAQCISFGDSVVTSEFLTRSIRENHSTLKCVELPDSRIVTIDEAIEYLKGGNE